mmetsp:Transcript_30594/g.64072  ORF Transcript_30594/g.64072 Transcript_30594/m.64072 type:complete len:158 (+) Transcript_30594:382-855(+)
MMPGAAATAYALRCNDGMIMEGVGSMITNWRASFAKFVSEEDEKDRTFNNEPTTANPKHWSKTRSNLEILKLLFGSLLPSSLSPSNDNNDDQDLKDQGLLPKLKHSNSHCNGHCRELCLFEWLHSLPAARVRQPQTWDGWRCCIYFSTIASNEKVGG